MEKDRKQPITSGDHFGLEVPVWYEKSGKVSSEWLSMCEEERNQTKRMV